MNKLEKAKNYVKEHKAEIIAGAIEFSVIYFSGLAFFEWGYRSGITKTAKTWVKEMNEVAVEKGLPLLSSKVTGNMFKGFTLNIMESK